jgi:hypothetical protein
MATQVQFRRGTTSEHQSFKGALGEVTVDTSLKTVVIHDAVTNGGFPVLRNDGSNSEFERGSTTSCALKFSGDPNTGLISPAADEIALVTGGVSRLTIDSNGAATFTGNVQVNGALTVTGGFDSGENLALIIALG